MAVLTFEFGHCTHLGLERSLRATLFSVERGACCCCIAFPCFALRNVSGLTRDALVYLTSVEIQSTADQGYWEAPEPGS